MGIKSRVKNFLRLGSNEVPVPVNVPLKEKEPSQRWRNKNAASPGKLQKTYGSKAELRMSALCLRAETRAVKKLKMDKKALKFVKEDKVCLLTAKSTWSLNSNYSTASTHPEAYYNQAMVHSTTDVSKSTDQPEVRAERWSILVKNMVQADVGLQITETGVRRYEDNEKKLTGKFFNYHHIRSRREQVKRKVTMGADKLYKIERRQQAHQESKDKRSKKHMQHRPNVLDKGDFEDFIGDFQPTQHHPLELSLSDIEDQRFEEYQRQTSAQANVIALDNSESALITMSSQSAEQAQQSQLIGKLKGALNRALPGFIEKVVNNIYNGATASQVIPDDCLVYAGGMTVPVQEYGDDSASTTTSYLNVGEHPHDSISTIS